MGGSLLGSEKSGRICRRPGGKQLRGGGGSEMEKKGRGSTKEGAYPYTKGRRILRWAAASSNSVLSRRSKGERK